jgi:hypothetical protein
MRTRADSSCGTIVAPRGHVTAKASHANQMPRSPTDPALATRPLHATARKEAIVGPRSFVRRSIVLKGLFGLIVIVALPDSEYVAHQRMSRAERVNLASTAKVLSLGAPSNASPSSAASLEAQSVIKRWFTLPQPMGATAAPSTVSSIRTVRIFPSQ